MRDTRPTDPYPTISSSPHHTNTHTHVVVEEDDDPSSSSSLSAAAATTATTTINPTRRIRVVCPLTEGHRILEALAPGWSHDHDDEEEEREGEGEGPTVVSSFSSSSSMLPLSVVWRPPPALRPFVTPEHIRVGALSDACVRAWFGG